jgi:hypothetical protein
MYAAFLQESSEELQDSSLADAASMLTAAGDSWRKFAVMAARICKNRTQPQDSYMAMAEQIRECGALEERFFRQLQKWLIQQP